MLIRNLLKKYTISTGIFSCIILFSLNLSADGHKEKVIIDSIYSESKNSAETLQVAIAQMRSSENLQDNVIHITSLIKDCAAKGVQVVVFPECALSGCSDNVIANLKPEQILLAEKQIARFCREANISAIVGTPYPGEHKFFNSAVVFSSNGKVIERYHKIQLAESWSEPGDHLSVFYIDNTPCSIIICHDERYPELVRLPVLAGAKVIFYISHESGLKEENKINPYRAQIQARAVENSVYIVHANAPANYDASGSHGQSKFIAPDGNVLKEASIFNEEVLLFELNLSNATRKYAKNSINRGILKGWWKEGVNQVRIIN